MLPSPSSPSLCFLSALVKRWAVVSQLVLFGAVTRSGSQLAFQSDRVHLTGLRRTQLARQSQPSRCLSRGQIPERGSQLETQALLVLCPAPPGGSSCLCLSRCKVWPLWVPGQPQKASRHLPHGQEGEGGLTGKPSVLNREGFSSCETARHQTDFTRPFFPRPYS